MTSVQRPPRRAAQTAVFRVVNVPMRLILGLPFRTPLSRRLMLVHHVGRKTGTHYRQPVSYVRDGDTLLTPGGGAWTRNLHQNEPVRITLAGGTSMYRPDLVADPEEVDRLFAFMAARNPALNRFVPIPRTQDGHLDPEALRVALDHGFRIIRWQPDHENPDHEP